MSVTPSGPRFLAIRDVCAIVALSRARVYELQAAGTFPPAVRIGSSARWVEAEVYAWVERQIAECPRVGMQVAS